MSKEKLAELMHEAERRMADVHDLLSRARVSIGQGGELEGEIRRAQAEAMMLSARLGDVLLRLRSRKAARPAQR